MKEIEELILLTKGFIRQLFTRSEWLKPMCYNSSITKLLHPGLFNRLQFEVVCANLICLFSFLVYAGYFEHKLVVAGR
jgi:hypothetical protein